MVARLAALVAAFVLFAAAPTGGLYVTTLPAGADVWLDGTYVGRSPVVVDALPAGRHSISLSRTGWKTQEVDVAVAAGTMNTSSTALLRLGGGGRQVPGTVLVHKAGSVRSVLLDGLEVGSKPHPVSAAAGVHQLVVVNANGARTTRDVNVYSEMRTDVVVRDEDVDRTVVVAPAADYLADGDVRRSGSRIAIRHGRHAVTGEIGSNVYRFDGKSVAYDAAPTLSGGKLYLPLELLTALTAQDPDR